MPLLDEIGYPFGGEECSSPVSTNLVITSPGFRTDQMWLSSQTTGLWMLKMTMYDFNCVSHGILWLYSSIK